MSQRFDSLVTKFLRLIPMSSPPRSGVYADADGNICIAIGGVKVASFTSGGAQAAAPTALTANGAIPVRPSSNYVITKAGVLAATLAAPTVDTDDGVVIEITSNTAFAHTLSAVGLLQTGGVPLDVAKFAPFAGASLKLVAYQGKWNVLSTNGVVVSSIVPTVLAVNGAINPNTPAKYVITKAGVLADTLAAPTVTVDDGVIIEITSNTAFAHTISAAGLLQTGGTALDVATFAPFAGASLKLIAYQGKWNVLSTNGVAVSSIVPALLAGDVAIDPHTAATYVITKGSAAVLTLAAPTVTVDDGVRITVTSNTAFAHTITATGLFQCGTDKIDVGTFAAFAGASLTLVAYQGKWNVLSNNIVVFT